MINSARLWRRVLGLGLAAALALTAVAGCGRLRDRVGGDDTTDMPWDAQALASVGIASPDLAAASDGLASDGSASDTAATDASAGPDRPRVRHPRLRFVFRNTLHGEATVQTEDGLLTVVAQRGTVTAVSATSLTVRSTDGYELTWAIGANTVVVVDRARSQISAVPSGTEVGVAGSRDGQTVTARLVVVPKH
ncbi:MAG TPA: hypothetical protein VH561_15210 [Micromonosporaceae bacterium]|jgi:hypothetical protein